MNCRSLKCTLAILALGCLPAHAGQVCPPASPLARLPGTTDVTIVQTSVSTAGYPGTWQAGRLTSGAMHYQVYANGSGSVGKDDRMQDWRVDFECDLAQGTCAIHPVARAPQRAIDAAKAIGDCLTRKPPEPRLRPAHLGREPAMPLAHPVSRARVAPAGEALGKRQAEERGGRIATPLARPPKLQPLDGSLDKLTSALSWPAGAVPDARSDAAIAAAPRRNPDKRPASQNPATSRKVATAKLPCSPVGLPDEAPVARVQRLLLLAGYDAGPVDGKPGARTRTALFRAVGTDRGLDDPAALGQRLGTLACPG